MVFKHKPVKLEAFRLGYDKIPTWFQEQVRKNNVSNIDAFLENVNEIVKIKTLEGVMSAIQGDFIIKGVKGEIYPCKPHVFIETFEYVPLRHIAEGDVLAGKELFLNEEHYLGQDVGDIIVCDENHKIMSEEDEKGLVTKIYLYDNNDGTVNTIPLYENGKRLMDKVLIPETFSAPVSEIDIKKVAYEFLRIEFDEEVAEKPTEIPEEPEEETNVPETPEVPDEEGEATEDNG